MGESMEGKCRSLRNLSVGKAEEKWGDPVLFVATTTHPCSRQGNTATFDI